MGFSYRHIANEIRLRSSRLNRVPMGATWMWLPQCVSVWILKTLRMASQNSSISFSQSPSERSFGDTTSMLTLGTGSWLVLALSYLVLSYLKGGLLGLNLLLPPVVDAGRDPSLVMNHWL